MSKLPKDTICWLVLQGAGEESPPGSGNFANPGGVFECVVIEETTMNIKVPGGKGKASSVEKDAVIVKVQNVPAPRPGEANRTNLNGSEAGPLPVDGSLIPVDETLGGDGLGAVFEKDLEFPETGFNDMVEMRCLSDAELNRNLDLFFHADRCYCMCGPTLVAINTFKDTGIFTWDHVQQYKGEKPGTESPAHCYKVANGMFERLWEPGRPAKEPRNQALVITGESGAGKTYTTKKVLGFLAAIGRPDSAGRPPDFLPKSERPVLSFAEMDITDQMLATTPILEAFGNAKMPRNDDSSRFGKIYACYFNESDHTISGCTITPYLLEKSRIVTQGEGSRGYHIFYEMLAGLSAEQKTQFKLNKPIQQYNYLNPPGITPTYEVRIKKEKDGKAYEEVKDDAAELVDVTSALDIFVGEDGRNNVYRCCAAVLQIGNIDMSGGSSSKCQVDLSQDSVQDTCTLLGIDPAVFQAAFSQMNLTETIVGDVSPITAMKFRDSLAKTIFNEQFEWLVAECSSTLSRGIQPREPFIGVLDIFGFEYTLFNNLDPPKDMNSFEQFCINLCNEKLQGFFVGVIFTLEKKMYKEEGLGDIEIDFEDNKDTIQILENNKTSVSATLDSIATQSAKDTEGKTDWDMQFFERLVKLSKDKKVNSKGRIREAQMKEYKRKHGDNVPQGGFFVEHYAANVLYDVQDWNMKNTDKISSNIKEMMANCGVAHMVDRFTAILKDTKAPTTLKFFKNKLNELVQTLGSCNTGFVRCIKPNREKAPNIYTADLVLTQLAYTGMLSTLQIQKGGYASRIKWVQFWEEFRVLDTSTAINDYAALVKTIEGMVPGIMQEMRWPPSELQQETPIFVGKQQYVLTRDWLYRELKVRANEIKGASAVTVQAVYRSVKYSADYLQRYQACLGQGPYENRSLIAMMRGTLARLTYLQKKWVDMQVNSRGNIHNLVRATTQRMIYYNQRKIEFETINRHDIQKYIYAALQRQRYYELKEVFFEDEKVQKECERFELYEGFTFEMNKEMKQLEKEEEEERTAMRVEEAYQAKLVDAELLNKLKEEKEEEEAIAENLYLKAMDAMENYRQMQKENDSTDRATSVGPTSVKLEEGAREEVRKVLIEQGVTPSDGKFSLSAPPLKDLPVDRENLTDMRAYYYQASAIPMRLTVEEQQATHELPSSSPMVDVANAAAERILSGQLELPPTNPRGTKYVSSTMTSNVDPHNLTPRQREAFQNQIATLLNVDPRHIRLS